jgi:hypothetical protein
MKRTSWLVSLSLLTLLAATALTAVGANQSEEASPQRHPVKAWSLIGQIEAAQQGKIPQSIEPPPSYPSVTEIPDSPDVPLTDADDVHLSENSIFVSPLNDQLLFCSNNSTDWPVTQIFGTQVGWSTDGGLTWTSQDEGPGGVSNFGDPAAVIDRDERFIVGYIDADKGQGVSYSSNMGVSWTHVTIASLPDPPHFLDLLDKNHLMVDNVETSPYEGRLYSAWTEFVFDGPNDTDIVFSYSADGGDNWSTLQNLSENISAGSHSQGVNIQTGPNGEVYVAWTIYDSWPSDETAMGFNSSMDGGVTWSGEARFLTNMLGIRVTTLPNEPTRANSYPVMAVDVSGGPRHGWIYVVWTNQGVPGVNTGDADIYIVHSEDGGTSWSTPVRVNQDATTNAQWFPWITCNPESGDLFVVFYDRRDDPGDLLTATYVAHSTDGGATWDDFQVSDVQFTPAPIPGLASGYMGDYLGIDASGCYAYPVFGDWRDSPFMSFVSPLFVDVQPPVITCPDDITVECNAEGGTPQDDPQLDPFFDGVSAMDNCDEDVEITHDAPDFFPLGDTDVIFTATDDSGLESSCTATVTVIDTTAPTITVELSRDVLWPPNHKLSEITATVTVDDVCDADASFVLTDIFSNEPDNGQGDGDTENDIQEAEYGTDDTAFLLRSERMGGGDGRKYTIVYTVTDASGNAVDDTSCVRVPHDQSGSAMAWRGFNANGSGFIPGAQAYSLVVTSGTDMDPSGVDVDRAYVGNHIDVVTPLSHRWIDINSDRIADLELTYDVSATIRLLRISGKEYALGLHYQGGDDVDYLTQVPFRPTPNPFLGKTHMSYAVSGEGAAVSIAVYDVAGRRIRKLVDASQSAGSYVVTWDGRNESGEAVRSGIYFYRANVGQETRIVRVTLMR